MANNTHSESGCLLGGVLSIAFFWWVFSPESFKIALIVLAILGVVLLIFWIVGENRIQQEKSLEAKKFAEAKRIEKEKNTKLKLSIEKHNEDYISEMTELNLYKNHEVNHLEFLKMVMSQYKSALNSDQAKTLKPDRYGRINPRQSDAWKSKLLEVCCTCKLEKKEASFRTKWAKLVSIHYGIVKEPNAEIKRYLNTAISLEATLRNSFNPEDRTKSTTIKNDLAEAFEQLKSSHKKTTQHDYDDRKKSSLEIGVDYEIECADILRSYGWNVEDTPTSGDQGADLLAYKNDLAVAIQCKNYKAKVTNTAVQEIIGAKAFYSVKNCVVVAKNGYTKSARVLAEANQVLLISEKELSQLEDFLD